MVFSPEKLTFFPSKLNALQVTGLNWPSGKWTKKIAWPSTAHPTVFLYISLKILDLEMCKTWLRAVESRCVSSKSLLSVWYWVKLSSWKERNKILPRPGGHWLALQAKQHFLTKSKQNIEIELVDRPVVPWACPATGLGCGQTILCPHSGPFIQNHVGHSHPAGRGSRRGCC